MKKIVLATMGILSVATVGLVIYQCNRERASVDDVFDDDVVEKDLSFEEDEFGRGEPLSAGTSEEGGEV